MNQQFKEREIAEKAKALGLGFVDLRSIAVNADVLEAISKQDSLAGQIVPFALFSNKLRVALVDPANANLPGIFQKLEASNFEIEKNLCSPESLQNIQKLYQSELHHEKKEFIAATPEKEIENISGEIESIKALSEKLKQVSTQEGLNFLHEAILKTSASDLHFEPKKDSCRVRARIDGVLVDFFSLPSKTAQDLVRQIKFNAKLKFNIANIPQDGKYSFATNVGRIDVRVATLPTCFGEGLVARFLDPAKGKLSLEDLGFSRRALELFQNALHAKSGLILVTGATGSGKTTTLQTALAEINRPEKKVITLENPIELQVPGILQCQINESVGFDFGDGVRAILRQDPNIVLVGEIRDQKAAQSALQASLTGHLVLSTLHTNSAAAAIPRLLNMGIEPFVLAPALRCVVTQTLVRKVCKKCGQQVVPSQEQKTEISKTLALLASRGFEFQMPERIFQEKGCPACSNTGFRGQTAIGEVLVPSVEIRKIIKRDVRAQEIEEVAKSLGMRTSWEESVLKVVKGETTFSEILRVAGN